MALMFFSTAETEKCSRSAIAPLDRPAVTKIPVSGECLNRAMLRTQTLDELSEEDLLDVADDCAEAARRAEVDLLRVAYQWAVLHHPDRIDPREAERPGREGLTQLGGPGTAPVSEFAAAELGARIGRSSYAAARLIADAQDLHHRFPMLWSR
jgi:hypothetical protein